MENAQESKVEVIKAKTKDFIEIVKQKAPVYWGMARTKTINTWNNGTKGKVICIGVAAGVLLLACFVFGGKSKDAQVAEMLEKSKADVARNRAAAQAQAAEGMRIAKAKAAEADAEAERKKQEQKIKEEEARRRSAEESNRQRVENENRQREASIKTEMARKEKEAKAAAEEKAAEEKREEELVADTDQRAGQLLSGVFLWGNNEIRYEPNKTVSFKKFSEEFYTIEDAFMPRLAVFLLKLHAGQAVWPAGVSQIIVNELVPRADHLLFYCCRTRLEKNATGKEKAMYVKMLSMAMMEKPLLMAYAIAFGQDSPSLMEEAERRFGPYSALRKSLPDHIPASEDEIEKRYAALPYPSRPVDLNRAADEVENDVSSYERQILVFLPREKEEPAEQQQKRKSHIAKALKRSWKPVEIGQFPIKSFCGMKLGEVRDEAEKVLGESIWHHFGIWDEDRNDYDYGTGGEHSYLLKKPFRQFTRAVLHFTHDNEYRSMAEEPASQEFEALRSIRLEADIPGDVNYQSCLDELVKVKEILEEKYKIDLGKGQAGEEYRGKSYWYGAGLSEKGWIVLGIRTATDGNERVTDGRKTMVLEIRYASKREMEDIVLEYKKKAQDKQAADAESKKKMLNVSKGEGADVL